MKFVSSHSSPIGKYRSSGDSRPLERSEYDSKRYGLNSSINAARRDMMRAPRSSKIFVQGSSCSVVEERDLPDCFVSRRIALRCLSARLYSSSSSRYERLACESTTLRNLLRSCGEPP